MNQEELQKKYMELQMLDQQMKQIQKQLQILETQTEELHATKQQMEEFAASKPGSEMLVQLGTGIFAKAELKDTKEFVVNVGSNVAVAKDLLSTQQMIDENIHEMKKLSEELMHNLQQTASQAVSLEEYLQKLVE